MATGKQIRKYRQKAGWKLKELAAASDVEVGTLSALEQRDSVKSEFFTAIAKALGLSMEQLQDESTDYPITPKKPPLVWQKKPFIEAQATKIIALEPGAEGVFGREIDIWTKEALAIMSQLDVGQKQAMVAKMREFKQYLGPPQDGQTLSVAA
jgi:transcriptional regulator with XRE-family HTH domain